MRGRYGTPTNMPTPHDRNRSMSNSSRDGSQYGDHRRLSVHGEVYPQAPAPMAPTAPGSFAVPTTPSSAMPPSSHYPQSHYVSPAAQSSSAAAPSSRYQDYPRSSPYQPYEHRPSDVSSYAPSDAGSRRPSESVGYSAHYSYAPARQSNIVPEPSPQETRLPPVRDLLRESDAREHELREKEQAGKRGYSPPRYTPQQPLKSGMRPSTQESRDEDHPPAFPGFLEYKRANGGLGHAPFDPRY